MNQGGGKNLVRFQKKKGRNSSRESERERDSDLIVAIDIHNDIGREHCIRSRYTRQWTRIVMAQNFKSPTPYNKNEVCLIGQKVRPMRA